MYKTLLPAFVQLLLLAALGLSLSACGPTLTPFTQKLYEENDWDNNDLQRIQFYLSDDVRLRRELTSGSSQIVRGEIKMVDGRRVEEIFIRRGTPGVFMFSPKEDRFAVSFEEGGNERYLIFGPNPRISNRYALLASDWERRVGTVTYDGQKWEIDSDSGFATLLVDLRRIRQTNVKSRVAGGRRVD